MTPRQFIGSNLRLDLSKQKIYATNAEGEEFVLVEIKGYKEAAKHFNDATTNQDELNALEFHNRVCESIFYSIKLN